MSYQINTWPTDRWNIPGVYVRYSTNGHPFFLYVNPDTQSRSLVLSTPATIIIPASLPDSKAFQMTTQKRLLPDPEGSSNTLTLTLSQPLYSGHFDSLIDDVVTVSNVTSGIQAAVNAFTARVLEWQDLFRTRASEALSSGAQTGLYGELWVLSHHLINSWGVPNAIKAWHGPTSASQDMAHNGCGIEVKATSSLAADSIPVSNILQLDDSPFEDLILVHVILNRIAGTGQSLPDMVGHLRHEAQSHGLGGALDYLLIQAGYDDKYIENYSEFGFSLREINYYSVRDGFPRLVEQTIPAGVGNTRYNISTAYCENHKLDQTTFTNIIIGYSQ